MKNKGMEKLNKIKEIGGLTQAQLAKMIGITQGALSHHKSGRRKMVDPVTAMKIIKVFPSIKLEDFYTDLNGNDNGAA